MKKAKQPALPAGGGHKQGQQEKGLVYHGAAESVQTATCPQIACCLRGDTDQSKPLLSGLLTLVASFIPK